MSAEVHIASFVAYARPEAVASVVKAIQAARLAEVPLHDDKGRIVIVVEGPSAGRVLDVMDAVRALEGVLAVHLAYQHCESEAEMQERHE